MKAGQKGTLPENLLHISYNDETWQSFTLPKVDSKNIWITSHTFSSADITGNQELLLYKQRNTNKDCKQT